MKNITAIDASTSAVRKLLFFVSAMNAIRGGIDPPCLYFI
jgi:hypothetical protein